MEDGRGAPSGAPGSIAVPVPGPAAGVVPGPAPAVATPTGVQASVMGADARLEPSKQDLGMFRQLLEDAKIDAVMPWEQALRLIVNDPRYEV